ncbi:MECHANOSENSITIVE ION CHANNEL PROTEIN 5 [Salix koriyanagi]|uniref:Mechanosensitive ion channel protein n=1 Tax=Salix koriyanagi TaxID=2511006 RepID=A0A9Q0P3M9_9ROSI|nr:MECHANOSENSITIVE ION CHANNEL PROTEIN 5 [Salix koriyanagi]
MEGLRKSLKSYDAQARQQPEHLEKGKQALLHHDSDCHSAQFSGSSGQNEEVIVNIDGVADVSDKETTIASKSGNGSPSRKGTGSAKKFKVSFEDVIHEAVRERSKDFTPQPSLGAFKQNSWRLAVNKAKSRLIDQPEQHYQRTGRTVNSDGDFGEEDDGEDVPEEYRIIKQNSLIMLQWASLVLIIAVLVCSVSSPALKRQTLWDLPLWKWEMMVLALICGRLVSGWGIKLVVIFIESNFLFRKRVLYFVYGLRRAVQNCLWLGLALLTWHFTFDDKVVKSNSKILLYGTKILVCFFIGTLIWLLKTILVKVLASSFHVNAFFERIQEALYNQYVLESLSGPPVFEWRSTKEEIGTVTEAQQVRNSGSANPGPGDLKETLLPKEDRGKLQRCSTVGKKPRFSKTMPNKKDEEISIDKMQKLNHKNISAWNMTRMVNIICHGALSSTLDEHILDSDITDDSLLHIRSECQAEEAAKKIFQKVAKTGSRQIYLDDMIRFLDKEAALKAMHLMGIACEDEGISKSSLKIWLVKAFRERRALALSLNDTKTAVDELHNMVNILVSVIIMIIWLIILGIPISHFLVLISSQLLLVVFIFGNTCKTVFEAIIFLFIMHPFDVGDRCEIDGIQLRVEEMKILTTVFLRNDNQKIIYPNSVLASKPIGNFYRSPDMVEAIDFSVHISTPMEKIASLKDKIKGYVEENSSHWHRGPMVVVTDVEDMTKMKMSLWVTHTMNHQEMGERWSKRNLLLEEMIKVFKELDIEYRVLPLDVNIRNTPPLVSTRLPSNWTTCAN